MLASRNKKQFPGDCFTICTPNCSLIAIVKSRYPALTKCSICSSESPFNNGSAMRSPVINCELPRASKVAWTGANGPWIVSGCNPLFDRHLTPSILSDVSTICIGLRAKLPSPISSTSRSKSATIGENMRIQRPDSPHESCNG